MSRLDGVLRVLRPHAVLLVGVLVLVVLTWWWADPAVGVLVTLVGLGLLAHELLRVQAHPTPDGVVVRRRGRETSYSWSEVRGGELTRSPDASRLLLHLGDGERVHLDLDADAHRAIGDHLRPHLDRVRLTDAVRARLGLPAAR